MPLSPRESPEYGTSCAHEVTDTPLRSSDDVSHVVVFVHLVLFAHVSVDGETPHGISFVKRVHEIDVVHAGCG